MRTWHTKRNCSFTPRQVGYFYLSMFLFSSFIATYFLLHGVWMILIFTVIELTVLGIALIVYARHALDYESIAIDGTALKIEKNIGGKIERHVFNTILKGRNILADQMDFLAANLPKDSRILQDPFWV